jgi:predicted transcriptional regulator
MLSVAIVLNQQMEINMSKQIRIRLSDDEIAMVKKIATSTNQQQTEIIKSAIRSYFATECYLEALAGVEQRMADRLSKLPVLVWQEVMRQSKLSKQNQGGQ